MVRRLAIGTLLLVLLIAPPLVEAQTIARTAFRKVWERTDYPVQRELVPYSWVWGPEPFTPLLREVYLDSDGGRREVQYFDKSRMEINDPSASASSPWYVTNGLLVTEMVRGQVQVSDRRTIPLAAAEIAVAGDPDNTFPTYASLKRLYNKPAGRKVGGFVTTLFLPEGSGQLTKYATSPAVEIVRLERGFGIPRVFWDAMNRTGTVYRNGQYVTNEPLYNWLYVLGYPITDAYWVRVRVDEEEREVLFQAFERRVLTYTPANPAAYRVEMGNVGRHYYRWRYTLPFEEDMRAVITQPAVSALVASPLLVQGFENGAAFEAVVVVRLRHRTTGVELARTSAVVWRPDVNLTGPFETTLTFAQPAVETPAWLEVLAASPRDGSESLLYRIAVRLRAAD
jgi:hypothetical protein